MLPILYQDDWLVAINKPSGLLVHRSMLDAHAERFAVQMLRDQLGRHVHPTHRLDKGTSGVLLFALDRETAALVSHSFELREVIKTYCAVVRGHPPESGVIDHPLTRQFDASERRPTQATPAPAQPAVTAYRRIGVIELPYRVDRYPTSRYALLELSPETGRRHQIRRHLKHISHPIIGDTTFGKGRHNRMFTELFGSNRMLLACTSLTLPHPHTRSTLHLRAPLTEDFFALAHRLGWDPDAAGKLSIARDSLHNGLSS